MLWTAPNIFTYFYPAKNLLRFITYKEVDLQRSKETKPLKEKY